ncbi:predicted protein [Lichtheimia corymbifera JMRC:FSU:9682]|uniref:Uncharacterized protein n=1 Tax=Lichtheimia corymbifera JMRC:FSU:9682 TaxID=1263082 RepID=A0A068S6Z5_9FUNG|nr:predicted protein [Lichtheimia corymbifera JMRC:FSU:9682]
MHDISIKGVSVRTGSIDVLAYIEGKFGFKTLAGLAFCFGSTTLHHGFRSLTTSSKECLCLWKRFLWAGNATWGIIIISLGSSPSLYQVAAASLCTSQVCWKSFLERVQDSTGLR